MSTWSGTSCTCVGHPCDVTVTTFWSWASFAAASLIHSSWLSVAGLEDSTKSMNAWTSSTVSGSLILEMASWQSIGHYHLLARYVFCKRNIAHRISSDYEKLRAGEEKGWIIGSESFMLWRVKQNLFMNSTKKLKTSKMSFKIDKRPMRI